MSAERTPEHFARSRSPTFTRGTRGRVDAHRVCEEAQPPSLLSQPPDTLSLRFCSHLHDEPCICSPRNVGLCFCTLPRVCEYIATDLYVLCVRESADH
eukprot:6309687-Prymnesium_polylepis.2